MTEFKVNLRESPPVNIVELSGYLDAHTAPTLENTFNQLIEQKKYKVIVNFEKLNYISSAGLGVFMAFIDTIRNNNGDIKLTNMSKKVFNIFDLLGFPLLYEIYEDEKQALEKFNSVK
ncbi:MAG: STAS domain-containing protein [Ignavibacteria bacterium]|nr:STAS domain-containing protein [Ignavibacteria bacterium]